MHTIQNQPCAYHNVSTTLIILHLSDRRFYFQQNSSQVTTYTTGLILNFEDESVTTNEYPYSSFELLI